jgi:hypothetical protein
MKNPLSSIYEQILLNEAEKSSLQNPGSDKAGTVKGGQDLFGSKPELKDTGKAKGEAPKKLEHEETDPENPEGKEASDVVKKSDVKGQAAPSTSGEVTASKTSKPKGLGEEVTMGAFETLFRKTLVVEEDETESMDDAGDELDMNAGTEVPSEEETETPSEETVEEEEGDLLTDLQDLQTRIADIITKLEQAVEDESNDAGDKSYSDEDFNQEFGEDESPEGEETVTEESLKVLGDKKKVLQNKNNKVGGKVVPKGGKANTGKYPKPSELKPLGDKKKALQNGTTVKSSLKKGESFLK